MPEVAFEIELDWPGREIRIDGWSFDYYVGLDPVVVAGADDLPAVVLKVFAENITVIEPGGSVRRPAVAARWVDEAWARERGRQIVREGLADVRAWLGEI